METFNEYYSYLKQSQGLRANILNNFTMEKMTEHFHNTYE